MKLQLSCFYWKNPLPLLLFCLISRKQPTPIPMPKQQAAYAIFSLQFPLSNLHSAAAKSQNFLKILFNRGTVFFMYNAGKGILNTPPPLKFLFPPLCKGKIPFPFFLKNPGK
ncbi:hypothetical protein C3766_12730 [Heyndrickxia coagulans]|nr:hypothetical protein C3766_12730 [Heyndrickxia coagulans]